MNMERPPRAKKERILNLQVILRGYVFLGIIEAILVMSGYFWVLSNGGWQLGESLPFSDPLYLKATTMFVVLEVLKKHFPTLVKKPITRILILVLAVIAYGTIGFHFIEGQPCTACRGDRSWNHSCDRRTKACWTPKEARIQLRCNWTRCPFKNPWNGSHSSIGLWRNLKGTYGVLKDFIGFYWILLFYQVFFQFIKSIPK